MERVEFAPQVSLSRIVYGMWRLGDDADTSAAHVQAKVESCLAQGITSLDTADIYGGYTAEGIFGQALKAAPHLRDKIEIVTKCDIVVPVGRYAAARVKHYDTSAAHIERSVEHSLREMATDHVDLLLIHRPDPLMNHRETGAALDRLVESGKALAVGVSNFRPYDFSLLQSAMETPLATNQIELSLLASDAFANGDIAFLQEHDIPVMAWSPLAGGRLFAPG
ncbi:oxidoreductase, partial [Salmonella enterica subsp. enterica]|nr:oxidoreductase [Escherichia coli]MIL10224.1 oxidoreductase [Salmonella enterica subsp. enterica serovar Enteritidis]